MEGLVVSSGRRERLRSIDKAVPFAALATIVLLLPFSQKAFHMDDPLFLWSGFNILENPVNFYGFPVNWYGVTQPMSTVMQNPPLASYYIALVVSLFGSGELALHLAFLIPAVSASLGVYFLAKELSAHSLTAALVSLATPAFLVSGTTVMCDVMMLTFWLWAVFFWLRGMRIDSALYLCISAVLICLSALSKYFALSLIPLLLICSLTQPRKIGHRLFFLAIPVLIFLLYDWLTLHLYGKDLLLQAASYASGVSAARSRAMHMSLLRLVTGLSFVGGGMIVVLFLTPFLWTWRGIIAGVALFFAITAFLYVLPDSYLQRSLRAGLILHIALFTTAGIAVIVLAIAELIRNRDSSSLFLLLWIAGTFVFAAFLNWTSNVRSILPIVPACGILAARRIAWRANTDAPLSLKGVRISLVLSVVISLLVSWADYSLAESAKRAAIDIASRYGDRSRSIWFQGHWGFQYYMQISAARPVDLLHQSAIKPGDVVVIPSNNSNVYSLSESGRVKFLELERLQPVSWLTTTHGWVGASFYASAIGGIVPYAIGAVPPEDYRIYLIL